MKRFLWILILGLLVIACSTEKNTFVSRAYHGTTAKYNGYFNANELINQSMFSYRNALKEDYYEQLPIDTYPNEKDVVGLYPSIDTAISKCTKVIQRHAMPSNDKPSKKKEEHNPWIDENWLTIGKAMYLRRDYEGAMKNFKFVKKFFSNDASVFVSDLWQAKINIEIGNLTDAGFNLANIDKALAQEAEGGAKKVKSKKGKKEEKIATVPKKILFDFYKTKALLALKKENDEEAIKQLKTSLDFAKKQPDKARVNYVIAQLYKKAGKNNDAKEYFTNVLKYNSNYDMNFNARMERAFMGGDDKVEKELKKMLRDAKNAAYKDQIYFALADIEKQKGNTDKVKEYLTKSAFYSTTNTRQKGMSYERLGDISYAERNYVSAQKYYDSCTKVIAENYPNGDAVRKKALKLADLVVAVEREYFEDSVQRIAMMGEAERITFIEKVIKQKQEEEKRRKEAEARKMRELQENQQKFNDNSSGNKWYFNNAKTRAQGFDEFRKVWGTRENQDDWRRSDKTTFVVQTDKEDSTSNDSTNDKTKNPDSLTVEMLLVDIPLTDSAMKVSIDRLMDALYTSGIIYKEQLNELALAKKQFTKAIDKQLISDMDLACSYQMFKMNEGNGDAETHKSHILTYYPTSDYANYIRDPNFFVRRKEMEALAVQEYVTVLERYNRGIYYPVMTKADLVINNEKENPYRAKYILLKAMCLGQLSSDKEPLKPLLNQVLAEYPGTAEATKAQEMLDILKNGYSKNEEVDFNKKSSFKFDDKVAQWVVIFLDKNDNTNMSKIKVSDFNKEFFSRDKLKTSSKIYGSDQSIILVQEFENDMKAKEYLRVYKDTRKHLLDLQKAKIIIITQENLKVLFEKQNLKEYEEFHDEYY